MTDALNGIAAIGVGTVLMLVTYLVFRRGEAYSRGEVISARIHPERFAMFKLRLSLLLLMLAFCSVGGLIKHGHIPHFFDPEMFAGLGFIVLAGAIATYVVEGLRTGIMDFFVGHTERGDFGYFLSTIFGGFLVLVVAGIGFLALFGGFDA